MVYKNLTNNDLAVIYDAKISEKYKIAFMIASVDGLRASEIVNLQLCDLEFKNSLYRLKTQKNGIVMGSRYMSDSCRNALMRYVNKNLKKIREHDDYIVYSNKGSKYSDNHFSTEIWRIEKKLGLRRIYKVSKNGKKIGENTLHAGRGKSTLEFALAMKRKLGYIDLTALMQHGGWKTLSMPTRYANMLQDEFIILNGQFKEKVMG